MKWLFFTLLPLLATFKVTAQGYFSKDRIKTAADSIKFNGFMFLYSAIALIILTVRELPSTQTIIYALILSVLTVCFQCSYALSFKTGAVSLSATIVNFSIVIPILFTIIFQGEKIGFFKITGFILVVVAILLMPSNDTDESSKKGIRTSKKWFFFIIIATISTGLCSLVQNVFAKSQVSGEAEVFTALNYAFSSVLCFAILPILKSKTKEPLYKSDFKINVGLILIGLTLGIYNLCAVLAQAIIPATVYFPTICGLQILTAVIASSIMFKERPSLKQLFGIIATILAVVFINLR